MSKFKILIFFSILILKSYELNPSHYGNPQNGCLADEVPIRVNKQTKEAFITSDKLGSWCAPECSPSGDCPQDQPEGSKAQAHCGFQIGSRTFCALWCSDNKNSCPKQQGAFCLDYNLYDSICIWDQTTNFTEIISYQFLKLQEFQKE